MKRILSLVLLMPLSGYAAKYDAIMTEWIDATHEQVTSLWGYPTQADHVIKIGNVTVFTYEFGLAEFARFGSLGTNGPCRVSFAFKDQKVIHYRWEGDFCPKLKRPK